MAQAPIGRSAERDLLSPAAARGARLVCGARGAGAAVVEIGRAWWCAANTALESIVFRGMVAAEEEEDEEQQPRREAVRLSADVVHQTMKKKTSQLTVWFIAGTSLLAAGIALFGLLRNGLPMYVLSDEFQAPVYLGSLLRDHGTESDIPIKPVTIQKLADLIWRLGHDLTVQKFATGGLSILCVISAAVILKLNKERNTAQQAVGGDESQRGR